MSEVTRILEAVERGEKLAASELLPLVYDELRRLAAQKIGQEKPGQTLQPTALVHEAYLRLVGPANADGFANRRHFFGAAAEAMRRILVDSARKKAGVKAGGGWRRLDLLDELEGAPTPDGRVVELDAALARLSGDQPRLAELVKLRFFLGLTLEQAAELLGTSPRTAKRDWAYARAWMRREMDSEDS